MYVKSGHDKRTWVSIVELWRQASLSRQTRELQFSKQTFVKGVRGFPRLLLTWNLCIHSLEYVFDLCLSAMTSMVFSSWWNTWTVVVHYGCTFCTFRCKKKTKLLPPSWQFHDSRSVFTGETKHLRIWSLLLSYSMENLHIMLYTFSSACLSCLHH